MKPRIKIDKWTVLGWPFPHLTGIMLEDHHTNPWLVTGRRVYTSRIVVPPDIKSRIIETENTIYELVGDGVPDEPVRS